MPDLEFAHTVLLVGCEPLDDAPILDLRIRKGVRRNGVKLAIASARPSALDRNAAQIVRCAPGDEFALLGGARAALRRRRGARRGRTAALAQLLRDGGEDMVIVWGERIGADAAAVLLRIAEPARARRPRRRRAARDPGRLQRPRPARGGRGPRRRARVCGRSTEAGRGAAEIAAAAADGEITALYLFQTDPVRDQPDRGSLAARAAPRRLVVAHASVLTEGLREHATVIFPAESHAEKEGTVVHPDGRLQRLRIAIERPGEVQPGWAVIAELARRAGIDLEVDAQRRRVPAAGRRGAVL